MSRDRRKFWHRWGVMERFLIGADNAAGPMLERLRIIQTPIGGIYLHKIFREDLDRYPHDHPWSFASFVLRGGYTEELVPDTRLVHVSRTMAREAGSAHLFPLRSAHRITTVLPGTITLCLVGPRVRPWGFHTPQHGWVDFQDAQALGLTVASTQGAGASMG